ncbi:hypothetical protein [Phreatobacter oligotrophus]|uniref:hypothetical protein n=1 Tax=Phreatobacter oligotrophus TaxID=1122261 RepID=UPI0023552138|nr:hypothetical protein [Phreatobacter oligotrophus]
MAEPARPVVIDAREARLASPRWLTLVSLAAALGFAGFGLGYSLLHALPTLYWDGWGYAEVLLGAHESGSLADWARALHWRHNEHRPSLAKLVMLADWYVRPGLGVWIHLALMATAGAVLFVLALADRVDRASLVVLMVAGAGLFLAPVHVENTTWFTQAQFPLFIGLSLGLIWAVMAARSTARALLVACPLAVLCTYTMAAGLLAPVAAGAAALLFRRDGLRALAMVVPALIAAGLASLSVEGPAPARAFAAPLEALAYGLAFLGSVTPTRTVWLAQAVGLAIALGGLGLIAWGAHRCWRRGGPLDPRAASLLGGIGLILAVAVATGLTRGAEGPPAYALVSRYALVSLTGLVLVILAAVRLWLHRPAVVLAGRLALVGAAVVVAVPHPWVSQVIQQRQRLADVADMARNGIADPEVLRFAYPSAEALRPILVSLRRAGLGFYDRAAGPDWPPLGAPAGAVPPGLRACGGTITAVTAIGPGAVRVSGVVGRATGAPAWILARGEDGAVTGWTRPRRSVIGPQSDVFALAARGEAAPGGIIGLDAAGAILCRFAMPVPTSILFSQMPFMPGLAGTPADVLFSGEGFDPALAPPAPLRPLAGVATVHGSGFAGAARRGTLRIEIRAVAAGQTLALPIAAGEDHRRQTVRLIDADGTVLAEAAPAFREHHLWSALLLPAALLRPGMALVVTDGGDGFGEWVAVGEPRWIAPPETGGRF